MSVQAMSHVIDRAPVGGNEFVTLLMIANHAHADGTGSYPSAATLAKETRSSVRTVLRAIKSLEAVGLLIVDRKPGRPNVYAIAGMAPATSDNLAPVGSDNLAPVPMPDWQGTYATAGTPPMPRLAHEPSVTVKNLSSARSAAREAIATACGIELVGITASADKALSIKATEIAKAERARLGDSFDDDGLGAEVARRSKRLRAKYPNVPLTPAYLAKYWPTLGDSRPGASSASCGHAGAIMADGLCRECSTAKRDAELEAAVS